MKLLYNMLEASINRFAIYYLYYKDKFSNLTQSFVFAIDNFYSLCSLSNFSTIPSCTTEQGLVMKQGELLKTSLHLLFHQPLSLLLSLTLSEIYLAVFEYLTIPQYATIFE